MQQSAILAFFESRLEDIQSLIREIVEVESPSRDTAQSALIAEWIERQAAEIELDLKVDRILADGFGEHIVIRAFPVNSKPALLVGHTDTVHPIGTKLINKTRVEEGRFYGCGIFDMKANIVLMLETLRFFAATGARPARPVTIVLSCDEEVGSFSGREIIEREAAGAEFCLVCEPSFGGSVKTGRKGTGMYVVKARGAAAHAGLEPEKGASAVLELARQIEKLHQLNNVSAGTTVNVCTMRGGTATNVIPEHAECTVDVRFSAGTEAEEIDAAIRKLVSSNERVSLEITGGINRPPLERTEAVVALYEKARRFAAAFGYDLGETQVGGASDGNFVAAMGVPVLDGLGVAGDGAHTLDEFIHINDIVKRAALLTGMIAA